MRTPHTCANLRGRPLSQATSDLAARHVRLARPRGRVAEAAGLCAGLPRPVRAAYEAGPTGYGLARELARRGVECVVAAPSKIPRASGDRVKTDRRDAEHLVRLLWAGKLHAVRVPGAEEEALRDLVRAREAVRVDLMRCRHRLSKLLLRHAIRFDDGRAWTERHRAWLADVQLGWPAAQSTLADAIGAVDALVHRREQLEREIVAMLPTSPWQAQIARLRCLRGIDTLTAAGLCSEIGDFERFARAADHELRRAGPIGEHDRPAAPPRRDHQDRLRARPPAAGRGCLALPQAPRHWQGPGRPPGRSARRSSRNRLERPAAPAPHLEPARATRHIVAWARSRRRFWAYHVYAAIKTGNTGRLQSFLNWGPSRGRRTCG
ncbi:MAG: transposase [Solirubrobacterales bacterium]|nr:transposase [Solirubrobacterales bacterium]